jgi:hypothetical protein
MWPPFYGGSARRAPEPTPHQPDAREKGLRRVLCRYRLVIAATIALIALAVAGGPAVLGPEKPHGGATSVHLRSLVVPWNNRYASPSYLFRPDRPLPCHLLTVRLEAPRSVASLSTFDYVVDLTNPTLEMIPLRPCPVYDQIFEGGGASYRLNCRFAPGLLFPRETVRFAMRISADSPPGTAVLDWRIDFRPNRNPHALARVRVTDP